jgi:hypothetical protein
MILSTLLGYSKYGTGINVVTDQVVKPGEAGIIDATKYKSSS